MVPADNAAAEEGAVAFEKSLKTTNFLILSLQVNIQMMISYSKLLGTVHRPTFFFTT